MADQVSSGVIDEVVQELGGACDDAPIDIAKARMREYRVMVQCAEANEAEAERYRARCPVLASDIGPEHTATRVLAFALANGWQRLGSTWGVEYAPAGSPTDCRDVPRFCHRHAKASGMAPLDVLDEISSDAPPLSEHEKLRAECEHADAAFEVARLHKIAAADRLLGFNAQRLCAEREEELARAKLDPGGTPP